MSPLRTLKPVGIQGMRVRVRSDVLLNIGIRFRLQGLPVGLALHIVQGVSGYVRNKYRARSWSRARYAEIIQ